MKPDVNIPQTGMTNSHPMNIQSGQYPFLLNGNIQTDITGAITLTNEHSNILCNNFPAGCKVIGHLYVPADNVTYVWLTDPTDPTKDQIGYLKEYVFIDFNDMPATNPCPSCGDYKEEDVPLEDRTQTPTCVYTPIAVSECFNFSVEHPVRTGVAKKDNCGDNIYYTDGVNPLRFLQLNPDKTLHDNQRLIIGYQGECSGTIQPTNSNCRLLSDPSVECFCCTPVYDPDITVIDCEKARLFPLVNHVCINPLEVVEGGSLRAGTYQLAVCYASSTGERATRTFSCSNPVSVFDPNQTLTAETSYVTDKSVKFAINDLEPTKYSYIDVFVVATINNVTSIKKYPTVDITKLKNNTLEYIVSNFELGEDVSIDDIFQVFPVYETAERCTTAGNTLLWSELKGPRDLNLQRAVIGMSPTLRWVTSEANEDFYANGAHAANYRGYLRDEVYALGIVFERNNTQDTCAYPFIGRDVNTALQAIEPNLAPPPAFTQKWTYAGEWIAFKNYEPANGLWPSDVVLYDGLYYEATAASGPSSSPSIPTTLVGWSLIGPSLSSLLCVNDLAVVNNSDVFVYPGCNIRKDQALNKNWEVYNTACRSGELCSPERSTIKCVENVEEVECRSFRYAVVPSVITDSLYASGDLDLTAGAPDASVLGIQIGMSVVGPGITPGTLVSAVGPGSIVTLDTAPTGTAATPTSVKFVSVTPYCEDISCSGESTCIPADCYVDPENKCLPCEDNYPSEVPPVPVCPPGADPDACCHEDTFPAGSYICQNPTPPVGPWWVRTKADALSYFAANNKYLLCIDQTLATLSSDVSEPFALKISQDEEVVVEASEKSWYIYDILDIQSKLTSVKDPTKSFMKDTDGPDDLVCLEGLLYSDATVIKNYLFPNVNLPDAPPDNYDPINGIVSYNPSQQNQCNGYSGPTAPLMYMLGEDIATPDITAPFTPCCTAAGENCDMTIFPYDYWGVGAPSIPYGEVNNTLYQSYWYSFTATALQPTIIIKAKIGYKFGEFLYGDPTNFMEDGDIRIDVYEGSPSLVPPTYSTGTDSVNPATYRYDGTGTPNDIDTGVLIIGDVANSTGDATTAGQLPLQVGQTYYVHIYMLPQGVAKLNKAPVGNPNKSGPSPGSSQCPCFFANYAWVNVCMNSATAERSRVVALPETRELVCKYELHYRTNEVVDTGCEVQTYEYGDFAYWRSDNKTYPNNSEVWGDLCGKPIRHFKFPDCLVTPVQNQDPLIPVSGGVATADGPFNFKREAKIYPLGIKINTEDVKAWLHWAVAEGLITDAERRSITGYKIVRGNRVGNKSIVAKGLFYDMWKYKEYDYVNKSFSSINTFYANYPFNDLRPDPYLQKSGSSYKAPFNGDANDRFAFLSPETTFNSPSLGVEVKMESVVFGDALGNFYRVKDHPKYILLSTDGLALASSLAAINLSADLLVELGTLLGQFTVGLSNTIPVGSIVGFTGAFLNLVPKFFIYAKEWRDIIYNFGVPKNFAKYYAGVGNYHSSGELGAVPNSGDKRRLINNSVYLLAGNLGTSDSGILSKINNYQREDSVYVYLDEKLEYAGTALKDPFLSDTSRFIMSSNQDGQACSLVDRQSNIASYYGSIKQYLPDQYGDIHDIEWLYTGKCNKIEWDEDQSFTGCLPIYGGDTFIGRMSQKRKIPFFLDNPVGANTGVDFQYKNISNITDAVYYFNSIGESPTNSSSIQFTEVEHKFDCIPVNNNGRPTTPLYLNGSMYLFSYGVVSFIGESSFNLNYRYATDTKFADFYPHQSDIENWTQEYRVPIETPNRYLYNRDYSKQNKEGFFCTQPVLYNNADCITDYRNRVINSLPDSDSDFYTDSWRIYLGSDYFDFPLANGKLIGLTGIEREKVLLRFENTSLVFNAYYTMTTDAGVAQIGTGSMFAQKPLEYAKTDLGYGGTQHTAFTSTQFGHFWVDAKRGSVFMLPPESGIQEISQPYSSFFNNNLPFFILKAFPNYPIDNNFKDIGIVLGWDNRFDRVFLTKLDYELLPSKRGMVIQDISQLQPGVDAIIYLNNDTRNGIYLITNQAVPVYTKLEFTNTEYFCNKSWTISYSPLSKTWISFYSFVPNYFIAHENYFQTGINYPQDLDTGKIGVWNHLITNKSYQVFYGTLYPFITDVTIREELYNKQLQSIEYQADFLRFQNDYDYFYNPRVTFNKMLIWSENRNTGILELVPQVSNNMSQGVLYPRANPSSTSVLVSRKENNWRVNQFADIVANKYSDVPPMILNCHPYLKDVNPDAVNYYKPTFQRSKMTSDYFTLRLINDIYSNYKIINKFFINKFIRSIT